MSLPDSIFITGVTGFLGGHILQACLARGFRCTVLVRKLNPDLEKKWPGVAFVTGNLNEPEEYKKGLQSIDTVIHAAGVISYDPKDRELMHEVNVEGSKGLYLAACQAKVKKFLHISSVVAIGANFEPSQPLLNEESPFVLDKLSLGYYETKRMAESKLLELAKNQYTALYFANPANVYGPGDAQKTSRATHVKVAQGKQRFAPPGGVCVVHVNDVVEGIFRILDRGVPQRRYILGGENLQIRALFDLIAYTSGKPAMRATLPAFFLRLLVRLGLYKHDRIESSLLFHWYSNERAQQELGMQFRSASSAIQDSIQWMKQHS